MNLNEAYLEVNKLHVGLLGCRIVGEIQAHDSLIAAKSII